VSMTKAEKAEVERLKTALGLAMALRFTDAPEEPDVPPPKPGGKTAGWLGNPHSGRVDLHWSKYDSLGIGADERSCASQGSLAVHSTRLRALKALRRSVERRCAEQLRAIDIQIESQDRAGSLNAALTPTREADGKL
jgi:hypothetical protein